MKISRLVALTAAAGALTSMPGCSTVTGELPPYGQALVVVDTDLPVPRLAGRLRVDVYASDGTWVETHDSGLQSPDQWPATFSVFTPADSARDVLVRVRSYPDGKVRDYRGERFVDRPAASVDPKRDITTPTGDGQPRLMIGGVDMTPLSEPLPGLAVDRLVALHLVPGDKQSARVTLRGACLGLMADLTNRASCKDTEGARVSVDEDPIDRNDATSASTLVGTFGATTRCTATPRASSKGSPLHDEEVCVPGGVLILGSPEAVGLASLDSVPERVAVLPPLLVDKYEYTVARYRDRHARGLAITITATNDAPLTTQAGDPPLRECTLNSAPGAGGQDREEFALNCISQDAAMKMCAFDGGRLLTEAEWEYVAAAAGRTTEARYPWGDQDPTCSLSWYAHGIQGEGPAECNNSGIGATRVTDVPADATPAGVHGLGGNVSEWVSDDALPYTSACWLRAPLASPSCTGAGAKTVAWRGGGWSRSSAVLFAAFRGTEDPTHGAPEIGFRCVRPGAR